MPQSKSTNFLGVMSSDASKSRRERNREAQQQFRKRRQAAEAARAQRLKHLEGIIEKMSTVIVGFTDKMLQENVLNQYPSLAADAQEVIAHVLALANEAGEAEDDNTTEPTEEASPNSRNELVDAQYSGYPEQSFHSSPMTTDIMHLEHQNARYTTQHSPEYSYMMNNPTTKYTTMQSPALSQAQYLPTSTTTPTHSAISWFTSTSLSPPFTY